MADKMMVGYHGRRDIEQYILAIMNIVSVITTSWTSGDPGGSRTQQQGASRNKSCLSPRMFGFGRGCRVLFLREDKREGNTVGKSDLF